MNPSVHDPRPAMLDAFNAATGSDLKMSFFRGKILGQLHRLGMTAEDVTAVMEDLKRLAKVKPQIYDEVSLQFGTALARVDKFEERAKALRKKRAAKLGAQKAAKQVPVEAALSTEEQERIIAKSREVREQFRQQMRRGNA
jgi:hypothetical protein